MSTPDDPHPPDARPRRGLLLLAAGAAAGLVLATSGLLDASGDRSALGPGVIAVVNGHDVLEADFDRLVEGVESERRAPIDTDMRRHLLDRMIDEELLVQRALELGLARVDRRVRADLTSSVIASIVAEVDGRDPTPEELERHYRENAEFFRIPGRIHVRQLFFRVPPGSDEAAVLERAVAARERLLAGEAFEDVRLDAADLEISPIPDAPLPPQKLREYVGPTVVELLEDEPEGTWTEPLRSPAGVHVLQVVARQPARQPPLDEIRGQIESDWRRRQGDQALRSYLDALREDGDVEIREDALEPDA